jgi:hypothetical protein
MLTDATADNEFFLYGYAVMTIENDYFDSASLVINP